MTLDELEQEVGKWAILSTIAWWYRLSRVTDHVTWIRQWRAQSMNDEMGDIFVQQARFRARLRQP